MSDPDLEIHQAIIDEHRRRPRHRGPLPAATHVATRENPACGDRCTLYLRLESDRIAAVGFTGAGCALSQASASLACVALTGRTAAEAASLAAVIETLVRGAPSTEPASPPAPGDLAALGLARAYPARHACALLAWETALAALAATDQT
ncbi:MAG: SUF system NifU family Fe-S cluster assembly protein [Opitutaceae bacterium]|jgi:nitrogen fixation NifU-like protein|nr:SUF system NifU family Fe-S cluster assembly protein [Opitutaceae bacterium]